MARIRYTKKQVEPIIMPNYEDNNGTTEYRAWTDDEPEVPGRPMDQKYSTLTVFHRKPLLHDSVKGTALNDQRVAEGKHPQLFFEQPSKMVGLFSDPSMRHTVPTLLGLAVNDNRGNLTYDESLSEDSAPLVKRGLASGELIPNSSNSNASTTNNLSRIKANDLFEVPNSSHVDIPEETVRSARDTVRQVLRPKKENGEAVSTPAHLSSQFHPQLPGLEG